MIQLTDETKMEISNGRRDAKVRCGCLGSGCLILVGCVVAIVLLFIGYRTWKTVWKFPSPDNHYICIITELPPPWYMESPYVYTMEIVRSDKSRLKGNPFEKDNDSAATNGTPAVEWNGNLVKVFVPGTIANAKGLLINDDEQVWAEINSRR